MEIKRKTEINEKTISIILEYLKGELSTRQAGHELGVSHQAVINLTASLLREWYRAGKVVINLDVAKSPNTDSTNQN